MRLVAFFDDGHPLDGMDELPRSTPPRGKGEESSGSPLIDTWFGGIGPASTGQLLGEEAHHLQRHVVRVKEHHELLGIRSRRSSRGGSRARAGVRKRLTVG